MTTRPDGPRRKGGGLDKIWEDTVRKKIQTSQIVNRLISFVNGDVKLEAAQVTAALGLLKKALPDLTSVEHSGEIRKTYVVRMPVHAADMDEWQKRYAPPQIPIQ